MRIIGSCFPSGKLTHVHKPVPIYKGPTDIIIALDVQNSTCDVYDCYFALFIMNNFSSAVSNSSFSAIDDEDSSEIGYVILAISLLGTATCLFSIYVTLATHISATSASIGAAATSFNTLFISLAVASLLVCGMTLPVNAFTAISGGKRWLTMPHRSILCLLEAFVQAS